MREEYVVASQARLSRGRDMGDESLLPALILAKPEPRSRGYIFLTNRRDSVKEALMCPYKASKSKAERGVPSAWA